MAFKIRITLRILILKRAQEHRMDAGRFAKWPLNFAEIRIHRAGPN